MLDGDGEAGAPEGTRQSPVKLPAITSLLHFVWLNKWLILLVWTVLAIPAGILLSIFNLPRSYTAATVVRFPNVVGAQTNVMRDVAITQGESIISVMNSFQVLEATIRKLSLRLRITTPEMFAEKTFRSVRYSDNLGLGAYTLVIGNYPWVSLLYRPSGKADEYTLFRGNMKEGNRLIVDGLELEINDTLARVGNGMAIDMVFRPLEETAVELRKSLSTRALGASNIEVRLKDRDPWQVAEILNTLRGEFLDVYYGTTEVQDVGILAQMEKDLELAKQKLERSQDELSGYYAAHPELMRDDNLNPGDNVAYLEARQDMERVQKSLARVQAVFRAKPAAGGPEQLFFWSNEMLGAMAEAGEPKASIQRASLQEIQQRQNVLKTTMRPEHPRIVEVEEEKAVLYRQIEESYQSLVQRLASEGVELKQRMVANTPTRAVSIPVKVQLELDRLNTVNSNNQDIYQRLQESYNRAKLVTGSEFFKVTVVDPARPALYEPPSFKSRLVVALGAVLLLSLLVPAVFVVWPIVFKKVWTKEDVNRLVELKTLGAVAWNPAARASRKRAAAPKAGKPKGGRKAAADGKPAEGEEPGPVIADTMLLPPDPLLLFAGSNYTLEDLEAYRVIREETESFFRTRVAGKYCLLMTSTQPNEGKTLTACNLAMTFARKGKRTLLIDADFRLGRVSKVFNIPASTGLDELLNQQDLTDDQFIETASLCFQATMQRNLVIAPRSRANPNAGELVSSDRFKTFIRLARDLFDVVIVDAPPIMITPEPLSLTEVVDGVLFVCLSGGTQVSDAVEAVEILKERNVRVAAILNGVKSSPFAQNRFRKYSYYYQAQPKPSEQGAG